MFTKQFKCSIIVGLMLASNALCAATINVSGGYEGLFTSSGNTNTYTLTPGDSSSPVVTSIVNLSTQTGTFTHDAGSGNTFFGTLDFMVNDVTSLVSEVYSLQVDYSGNLQVLGGTGLFDGASGNGTFTGTDLYFAIFAPNELENTRAIAFLDAIAPAGTATQKVSMTLTTGEVSAVPVPAAAWLFGSGMLWWAGMLRRKSLTQFA